MREVVPAAREVVLVTSVGIPCRVGVVLEQIDHAPYALVAKAALRGGDQALENALSCLVMRDEVFDRVTFGSGVLGVASHVEVQPGSVLEKDVARTTPAHDTPEQVTGHFVGAEAPLAAQGASHAVFVLEPENPAVHRSPR